MRKFCRWKTAVGNKQTHLLFVTDFHNIMALLSVYVLPLPCRKQYRLRFYRRELVPPVSWGASHSLQPITVMTYLIRSLSLILLDSFFMNHPLNLFPLAPTLEHSASVKAFLSLQYFNFRQWV